jgi:hypothetical protein
MSAIHCRSLAAFLTTGCQERKVSGVRFQLLKNFKKQNTNTKQITMTEIQNPKQLAFDLIEIWILQFGI